MQMDEGRCGIHVLSRTGGRTIRIVPRAVVVRRDFFSISSTGVHCPDGNRRRVPEVKVRIHYGEPRIRFQPSGLSSGGSVLHGYVGCPLRREERFMIGWCE
jgi:hypothetical protein